MQGKTLTLEQIYQEMEAYAKHFDSPGIGVKMSGKLSKTVSFCSMRGRCICACWSSPSVA